jgi:SAM-dependent methyltransferase
MYIASVSAETETIAAAGDRPAKFDTRDAYLALLWDSMQRDQVDFAVNQDLAAYYTSPQWRRARQVLDLGTGNGYYLERIASHFPEKRYRGIDTSPEMIALAHQLTLDGRIEFETRDVFEETGQYDFVIMRLLLQHLPNPEAVLARVAELTEPGAAAFVIEADDPLRFFSPAVPEFMKVFHAYTQEEASRGLHRDIAERVPTLVASRGEWRVGETQRFVIPSTLPGNLGRFRRIYGLFLEMVERAGGVEANFTRAKREWEAWCAVEHAYAQVGVTVIQLDRI